MGIEQMRIRMGEMAAEIERMQSIIDEQQSPAVAVPDNFNGDDRKLIECSTALLKLDAKGALVPHGLGGHARAIIESLVSRLSVQSPRITEQDALVIAQYAIGFMNGTMKDALHYAEKFMGTEEGRALLNKLNAKPVLYVAPIAKGTGDGSSEENSMPIAGVLRQDCIGFDEGSENPHIWRFNTVDNTAPISGNAFVEGDKPESVGG